MQPAGWQMRLTNILQQDRDAELDCILQGAHVVAVCQLDDAQVMRALHRLDPLVGLVNESPMKQQLLTSGQRSDRFGDVV